MCSFIHFWSISQVIEYSPFPFWCASIRIITKVSLNRSGRIALCIQVNNSSTIRSCSDTIQIWRTSINRRRGSVCMVMTTAPDMMQSGLSHELFETCCSEPKNGVIIAMVIVSKEVWRKRFVDCQFEQMLCVLSTDTWFSHSKSCYICRNSVSVQVAGIM